MKNLHRQIKQCLARQSFLKPILVCVCDPHNCSSSDDDEVTTRRGSLEYVVLNRGQEGSLPLVTPLPLADQDEDDEDEVGSKVPIVVVGKGLE